MSLNMDLQQRFENAVREHRKLREAGGDVDPSQVIDLGRVQVRLDRALEVNRAKEASRYARRAKTAPAWQRVSPELAVLLMLALAALAAAIAWAGRAWGF